MKFKTSPTLPPYYSIEPMKYLRHSAEDSAGRGAKHSPEIYKMYSKLLKVINKINQAYKYIECDIKTASLRKLKF